MPGPGAWLAMGALVPAVPAASTALAARLVGQGWRRALENPDVWLPAGGGLPLRSLGWGVLIGRYEGILPTLAPDIDGRVAADRLMSAGWGRWVALLPRADGLTVLRDPSGALDAVAWRHGPLWVAASDAHEALDDLLPTDADIDSDRVLRILAHPAAVSGTSAIHGLDTVAPGGGLTVPAAGQASAFQTWTPARAAARNFDPKDLRPTVDRAVRTLLAPHSRFLGEISGGFDSAVVATSAAAQGLAERSAAWLNFWGVEPEADERRWARSVARNAGFELTERVKTPRPLTLEALAALCGGVRPALQGLDVEYDAHVAERLGSLEATALLTGQGGDAVFFQFGTSAVAIDRTRRLGLAGLGGGFLHRTAVWTRQPAWRIAEAVLRDRLGFAPRREADAPPPPGADVHPWLSDLETVPPARRGQIRQLVNAQIFHGDCLRARAGELLHPLLSQPVMEAGLGIPTDVLVEGGRDRDLARRQFADRLPSELTGRRGKGELSTYYGHVVRLTLPLARDLLLDGELVKRGLADRAHLEATLDPQHLIADGAYNEVLIRLVLELWLRRWRRRLSVRREPLLQP